MRTLLGRGAGFAVLLGCSALALLAAAPVGTAPTAKVTSPWRLFGRARAQIGYTLLGPSWASNRVWVVPQWGDGGTLASARVSGGTLRSFTTQPFPGPLGGVAPTGSRFFEDRVIVGTTASLATAPLLPDGRLGARESISQDLLARAKEVAPKVGSFAVEEGVRVGGRVVWALEAGQAVGFEAKAYQLVCCSESGAAVDLTSFIDQRAGVLFAQIGLDARRRLWVAWLDRRDYPHAARGVPRILELDPSSLAPRTKALAPPGVIADRLKLACAASCRLVAQTPGADIVSWAPGEARATRLVHGWHPGKVGPGEAWLLDATYRSGHLVVAYHGHRGKTQFEDATVRNEIRIVRGDARGAHAREVSSIPVAESWPPSNVTSRTGGPVVYGTFTPAGFVAVEFFQFAPGGVWSPVVGAFVPVA